MERITPPSENITGSPSSSQARQWILWCHLSGLLGLVFYPIGSIVAPLLIWQIKKDEFPELDAHGKEVMNFQISMFIYTCIAGVLTIILIGLLMLGALFILYVIFTIMAALEVEKGRFYRYPLTIRFFK